MRGASFCSAFIFLPPFRGVEPSAADHKAAVITADVKAELKLVHNQAKCCESEMTLLILKLSCDVTQERSFFTDWRLFTLVVGVAIDSKRHGTLLCHMQQQEGSSCCRPTIIL
jgi:hypothetical protein